MLRMVSYSRRPQSGHIVCYLNRTYHVLTTPENGPRLHFPLEAPARHVGEELRGLREDKQKSIRSFAKFLAEDAA